MQAIGDHAPEVITRAVQKLLNEAVGATAQTGGGRAGKVIQVYLATHQVNGRMLPGMGDRIGFALDLKGFNGVQATIVQRRKERQEPAFSRERGAQFGRRTAPHARFGNGARPATHASRLH